MCSKKSIGLKISRWFQGFSDKSPRSDVTSTLESVYLTRSKIKLSSKSAESKAKRGGTTTEPPERWVISTSVSRIRPMVTSSSSFSWRTLATFSMMCGEVKRLNFSASNASERQSWDGLPVLGGTFGSKGKPSLS